MDINKLTEQLKKPLPEKAIKQHPTKTYLSSIKAVYVTERLTDVFGVGGWKTKVEEVSVNKDNGMVVVKVTLEIPKIDAYYESYGGNDNGGSNNKNFDLGDAFKGATTDAITKIGSYLGIGIDVFKGEAAPTKNPDAPKKPWLNKGTSEWDKVIDAIRANKVHSVDVVRQKYAVNKDLATELESLINEVK